MTELITLRNVSKSYDSIKAVDDISFSVKKGEILGFLGPNGAGKTTAMKMITGYMPAGKGEILINGKHISDNPLATRNSIGYLPENNPLYSDMTVDEYLDFIADMRNIPDTVKAKKEAMEKCGVTDVRHRIIGHLSKGYKQRVGLAQAIMHNPEILILDEPVNGLDPKQIIEIRHLIHELGKEKTVILCSHILSEVEAVATRVVIINQGRIVADDTIDKLKQLGSGSSLLRIDFLSEKDENSVISKIGAISGIISVEKITPESYRIKAKNDRTISHQIFLLAAAEKWDVSQIFVESSSFENMFLSLTDGGAK